MKLLIHPSFPSNFMYFENSTAAWSSTHWTTIGRSDATDVEVFEYASFHGLVVICADIGLRRIVFSLPAGCARVLQIRGVGVELDFTSLSRDVMGALRQMKDELELGAVVTLTFSQVGKSLRALPFGRRAEISETTEGSVFVSDGFLPESLMQRAEWPEAVRSLGNLCIRINRLSLMRLGDVKVGAFDAHAALCLLLFSQATTGFEAACLLAGTGMEGEARAQARNCLEAAIICYAHAFKPELDIVKKLDAGHRRHYVTWLKALKDNIGLCEGEPLEEQISEIIATAADSGGASINLEQLAKEAGIAGIYAFLYRHLSAEGGHLTWDSLRKLGVHDEVTGNLVGVSIRPRFERLGETLALAAQCQLVALKGLQVAFPDVDIDDIVQLYERSLHELSIQPISESDALSARQQGS